MKKVHPHHHFCLALTFLTISAAGLFADEPVRSRATPIIFSAPQTDTVSSNLNQIGTRSSSLTDLESGLKKPFEVFDLGRSSGEFRSPINFAPQSPPAPVLNNKKLKDLLDKRAEDNYLLREDHEAALEQDDLFKSENDPLDSSRKRLKTPLDRYYDRVDRSRLGPTNQTTRSLELFGEKTDPEEKDSLKPRLSGGLFDNELSASARSLRQMSNGNSAGMEWLSPTTSKTRSFGEIFGLDPVEPVQATDKKLREARMDEFQRLLNGPSYGSRNDFNVTPPSSGGTAYQPPKPVVVVPSPILSVTPQPALGGSSANTPGFVGSPLGVSDHLVGSPSLTPTPPLQQSSPKPPPPPTFSVPRRRF